GGVISLRVCHKPQVAERVCDSGSILQFAPYRQALLNQWSSGGTVSLCIDHMAKIVERVCDSGTILYLAPYRQALFMKRTRRGGVALIVGKPASAIQRFCTCSGASLRPLQIQNRSQPFPSLLIVATDIPEGKQRSCQA